MVKKGAGKSKAAGGGVKASGDELKAAGGGLKAAGDDSEMGVAVAGKFPRVELKAPARTGRSLKNIGNALDEFEFRLKVAEKYLPLLKPALTEGDEFLSVGWTAASILRGTSSDAGDGAVARSARAAMVSVVGVVRDIVVRLTRPGDPARAAVLVGAVLDPKRFSSVEQGTQVLAGAKEIQSRFKALTDELLNELAVAVDAAAKASGARKDERATKAVEQLSESDERQLAVDVVHHCADELAAAALATLRTKHPNVAQRLFRALEPDAGGGEPEEPPSPAT